MTAAGRWAALFLLGVSAAAAQPRAVAEVVSEPVEVGAALELEVRVEHADGAEAAPVLEESLGDFRVLDAAAAADPEPRPGRSRFVIRLGAFVLPGDHRIPPVPVGIRLPDGELSLIETPPTPLRVVSSLPPEEQAGAGDIHDIRGPFELRVPPRWGRIALVFALLLALAAAAWFWLRRRARREVPAAPPPPPVAEAEAALARLSRSGLLEAGEVVAYYERLAAIMKRYAGRRFATAWNERTTGEILSELDARIASEHAASLPLLAGVLDEADLAKFSDRPFRPAAALLRFAEAGAFLDRTRPPVLPPSEAGAEEDRHRPAFHR